MTRMTISLPEDTALWLNGYACARKVSRSRVISDLLIEKRATLTKEAEELHSLQPFLDRLSKMNLVG